VAPANPRTPCEIAHSPFQNHILFYSKSDAKYILQGAVQPGHVPSRFTVKPYLPVTGIVAIMSTMPKRMPPQLHLNVWSTWRNRRISSSSIIMLSKLGREVAERMKKHSSPPVSSLDLRMADNSSPGVVGGTLGQLCWGKLVLNGLVSCYCNMNISLRLSQLHQLHDPHTLV
jgi:hypothetical protein